MRTTKGITDWQEANPGKQLDLRRADLSDANLRRADLSGADLRRADLRRANLSGANLPKIIKVDKLFTHILAAIESGGELHMGSWHECETVHCIAGWVVTLAGEAGRVAENLVGTPWSATIIINESCQYLKGKVPNFYATDEEGMAFIKECVAKETKAAK